MKHEGVIRYAENKKKAEELEDERDRLIIELKRNATNLELEKISLQKKLAIAESLVCKNSQCKERQS